MFNDDKSNMLWCAPYLKWRHDLNGKYAKWRPSWILRYNLGDK